MTTNEKNIDKFTKAQRLSASRCWAKGDTIADISDRLGISVYDVMQILRESGLIKHVETTQQKEAGHE